MQRQKIKAETRDQKISAAKVRQSGSIPAVIYNHGQTATIQVDAKAVRAVFGGGISESTLFDLEIAGKTETAFVKDYQLHPVTDEILHLDFYRITVGERIKTHIPVHLVGKPEGVAAGGVLEIFLHNVEIEADPVTMPPTLDVDISALQIGQGLHMNDIALPAGVKVLTEGNPIICHVSITAKAESTANAEG